VITSKLPFALKTHRNSYLLIGPYFHQRVKGVFEETIIPDIYKQVCEELRDSGIVVHYGRWLTEGNPYTILLDFQPLFARKNEIKGRLWDDFKIDSLNSGFDFDEPVIWSYAAGMVIERFTNMMPDKKVSAIFHEWLSGAGLLYLKTQKVRIGKVFVTHATVMGRSLANAGHDMYRHDEKGKCLMQSIDFEREAYNRQVHYKHQLEKVSAHAADVFSTVSEITGMEAEHILGKKPDILLPNGLDINNFPSIEENSIMHRFFRDKILHFLLYYFFPYYNIDIEKTLVYFTAARYELHDKGIDTIIRALGKLNETLKREKSKKNIVVFFWIPSAVRGIKPEIMENKMFFNDIENSIKENSEEIIMKLISTVLADNTVTKETLFTSQLLSEIKSKMLRFKRDSPMPPVCTHDLSDPYDPITRMFAEEGLDNSEDDKVKVIFYPTYLTGADGLLDLTHYEAMQGSHFGMFPSFYEPWGYTPVEAGALGVASVTSDLSGFGKYIMKQPSYTNSGIFTLERNDKSEEYVIDSLFRLMYYFSKLPKKKRIENKLEARRLASLADWAILSDNYVAAQNLAITKAYSD